MSHICDVTMLLNEILLRSCFTIEKKVALFVVLGTLEEKENKCNFFYLLSIVSSTLGAHARYTLLYQGLPHFRRVYILYLSGSFRTWIVYCFGLKIGFRSCARGVSGPVSGVTFFITIDGTASIVWPANWIVRNGTILKFIICPTIKRSDFRYAKRRPTCNRSWHCEGACVVVNSGDSVVPKSGFPYDNFASILATRALTRPTLWIIYLNFRTGVNYIKA